MDYWINKLREQTAMIANGNYVPGSSAFIQAPAGLVELSRDLDSLALVVADRARIQQALIHEVHHRVKNNLQIVTSLLRMQASKIQNNAAREALGQAHVRVGALAIIHRMLYEQSDDGKEGRLDLAGLMTELSSHMRFWYRERVSVKFICNTSSVLVPLDSAMPLAMFAVEAVSNVYAHAYPDRHSGEVTLDLKVDGNDGAELRIADNGVGFDTGSAAGSMGFQLMNAFAQQLGGTLDITSSAQTGTEVKLAYRLGEEACHAGMG